MKVLLLSGGVDSTVAAHHLMSHGHKILALSLYSATNAENRGEIESARKLCKRLNIEHVVANVSALGSLYKNEHTTLAVGGDLGGCCGSGKRGVFLGVEMMHIMAAMLACEHDAEAVVWALNKDDIKNTSEANVRQYINQLEALIALRTGRQVRFELPFIKLTKAEVINLGNRLGADLGQTYSCLEGGEVPCGKCRQCVAIEQAFRASSSVYNPPVVQREPQSMEYIQQMTPFGMQPVMLTRDPELVH